MAITKPAHGFISFTAGGHILHLGILSFPNYTGLNVKVKIQETVVQIKARTDDGISVVLPCMANGLYNLSVSVNSIPLRTSR